MTASIITPITVNSTAFDYQTALVFWMEHLYQQSLQTMNYYILIGFMMMWGYLIWLGPALTFGPVDNPGSTSTIHC